MKKILLFAFFGFILSSCATTATSDDATPQQNTNNAAATQPVDPNNLTDEEKAQIAHQQIIAFEQNQVKMYTQPVNN
jgi:PBP1b-binding outer membrane lipoprotein LpoB